MTDDENYGRTARTNDTGVDWGQVLVSHGIKEQPANLGKFSSPA